MNDQLQVPTTTIKERARRQKRKAKLGKAIYILPNLVTSGNLFFGFFSIIKSLNGDFKSAAIAIFIASVFDMLDGRVARLTRSSTEFGVQYDSLCDLVSFGLAPSVMLFQFSLSDFGRIGWILCFVYLACGALRLARFNVESQIDRDSDDFTGLPIPMAALLLAGFVLMLVESNFGIGTSEVVYIEAFVDFLRRDAVKLICSAVFVVSSAALMVSNVAFRSHKSVNLGNIKPFRALVLVIVAMAFLAYQPEILGFSCLFLYCLSGPLEYLFGYKKAVEEEEIFAMSNNPLSDDSTDFEGNTNEQD